MPEWYNIAKHQYSVEDLAGMTLKVMLVSSYSFNPDHATVSGLGATELTGTGYTSGYGGSGRTTLANLTGTQVDAIAGSRLTGDNVDWVGINAGTIVGAVLIYETGGSDATAIPIAYFGNGTIGGLSYTTDGKTVRIVWPDAGILVDYNYPDGYSPAAGRLLRAYTRARHKYSLQTLAGKTLKALLVDTSFVFDPADNYVEAVAPYELSGTGYARQTLAGVASNQDDANDRGELDCDNIVFGSGDLDVGNVGGVVIYIENTTDADHELVCAITHASEATDGTGSLTYTIDAEGFLHDEDFS